ncbi:MAG: multiheme c-type cytochrome, partial [Planctomycetota bacterium]
MAFAAETLEGWRYDFAERNARRRVIVYLVDVTAQDAEAMTAIAQRLHEQRHRHHFEIVGVAVPPGYEVLSASRIPRDRPSRAELARLARRHLERAGAMFPCVLDPDAAIVERYVKGYGLYKLGALPAFYAFEPRALRPAGRPIFATHGQPSPEHAAYIERRVLKRFGIEQTTDVDPLVGHHPPAPDVTVTDLRGEPHRLADYRGRVVVFVLIAEHCSRCKQEMRVLEGMLGTYGHGRRPEPPWLEVLAVCVDASGDDLRELVAERGYTATVGADPDWSIRSAFRYRGATPDTFVIDPHGRIRFRHRGYLDDDEPVLHMEIRTLLGLDTRPLLDKGRYAGDRACRVCHERQHADWTLTRHACAWETLVRLGKQDDPKCARCHVVGFGQRGGFVSERRTPGLRDVQCESCHGRNGCAAFAGGQAQPVTAATCTPCHDPVHSPRFDLETYRPRVLHNRAATLAKLPRAERQQRLARLCSTTNAQLFDRDIPYVGSAACGACHPTAYKALQDGVHARALTLLARPARDHWSVPRHKRGVTGLRKPQ